MFLTQCARCHWTPAHSSAVTSRQPGSRVQSGSTSWRRTYAYGCSTRCGAWRTSLIWVTSGTIREDLWSVRNGTADPPEENDEYRRVADRAAPGARPGRRAAAGGPAPRRAAGAVARRG